MEMLQVTTKSVKGRSQDVQAEVGLAPHSAAEAPVPAELMEAKVSDEGDKSTWGIASTCIRQTDCNRNDMCQKIGNDGFSPLSGTTKCKDCLGSRKCQIFPGVGTGFKCGCTVR